MKIFWGIFWGMDFQFCFYHYLCDETSSNMKTEKTILDRGVSVGLRPPKSNFSLIRLRCTVNTNEKRLEYDLPACYKICPEHWDKVAKCAITDGKRNKDLKNNPRLRLHLDNVNTEIVKTKNVLIDIIQDFQRKGVKPSVSHVKLLLSERMGRRVVVPKVEFLLDFAREYVTNNVDLQEQTKRQHLSAINVIEKYSYKINKKLRFDDITVDFRNEFMGYLKTTKHDKGDYYKPNTIARIFKNIKTWMGAAYDKGLTNNHDFQKKSFGVPKEDTDKVYLKTGEIEQMYAVDLSGSPRLEKVRDVFVIMCYMGIRYSDYLLLKKENISPLGLIRITTKKTKTPVEIPMHDRIRDILKKYDGEFPHAPSNQKFNDYISEVIVISGLERDIVISETKGTMTYHETTKLSDLVTAHTARRSCATNMFLAGVPVVSIMKITGHKTEKEFMRYIRITQEENALKLQNHSFYKTKQAN